MLEDKGVCAVEIPPERHDDVLGALTVLESAGVTLLRFPESEYMSASGPMFPVCGASGDGPMKYVFYLIGEKDRLKENG